MKIIQPTRAERAAVLRILLDLADNKRDVRTTTDYGRLAVTVPDELYDRFQRYQALPPPAEPKKRGKKS